nr:MAG TPA: Defensin propeptide [Caudoviricetes sp.]
MTVQARDSLRRTALDLESQEITISFGGDAEFRNFCEGIEFIDNQLKQITGGN